MDLHHRREELKKDLNDGSGDRIRTMEALQQIDAILENRQALDPDEPFVTGDPLVDKWERELAEGGTPDLEEGLHG